MKKVSLLTLTLPGGCNLACPGCIIAKKNESGNGLEMTKARYEAFPRYVRQVLSAKNVERVALQGEEVTLGESWPTALKVAKIARNFAIPIEMVTNGVRFGTDFELFENDLNNFSRITVSLESADEETNNRLRPHNIHYSGNVENSNISPYHETVTGIRNIINSRYRGELAVASVLFPGKVDYLRGMPELLRELGVKEWVLGLYINPNRNGHQSQNGEIIEAVKELGELSKEHGIELILSDELRTLEDDAEIKKELGEYLDKTLEEGLLISRLSPNLELNVGREELLKPLTGARNKIWDEGKENGAEFLERRAEEVGEELEDQRLFRSIYGQWSGLNK